MRKHQQRIIILYMLPHVILPNLLALRYSELNLPLLVQNIHLCDVRPAMEFHGLPMGLCGIALSLIGGVALNDGALHMGHHRSQKIRSQKILISHLSGMKLDSDSAGKLYAHGLIHSDYSLRRYLFGEINLCLLHIHVTSSCYWVPDCRTLSLTFGQSPETLCTTLYHICLRCHNPDFHLYFDPHHPNRLNPIISYKLLHGFPDTETQNHLE